MTNITCVLPAKQTTSGSCGLWGTMGISHL